MRFIEPKELGGIINEDLSNGLTASDLERILALVDSSEKYSPSEKQEMISFLDFLSHPRNQVFYGWTISNKELLNACLHQELKIFEPHKKPFYLHAERENFYAFLTHFIAPFILSQIKDASLHTVYQSIFYSQFLSKEKKIEIQGKIKINLESFLGKIKSKDDLSIAYSIPFIESLNLLDRNHYSVRLQFTKIISDLLLDKDLAVSEKQKLASAIKRLNLNADHKNDFEKFIKTIGLHQLKSSLMKSVKRKIFIFLLVIIVIATVVYVYNTNQIFQEGTELKIIPPYGTDSLNQEDIDYVNDLFKLELDSLQQDTIQKGVKMNDVFIDTIK